METQNVEGFMEFPEWNPQKNKTRGKQAVVPAVGAVTGYEFSQDVFFDFLTWLHANYPDLAVCPEPWHPALAVLLSGTVGAVLAYALGRLNNYVRYKRDQRIYGNGQ